MKKPTTKSGMTPAVKAAITTALKVSKTATTKAGAARLDHQRYRFESDRAATRTVAEVIGMAETVIDEFGAQKGPARKWAVDQLLIDAGRDWVWDTRDRRYFVSVAMATGAVCLVADPE